MGEYRPTIISESGNNKSSGNMHEATKEFFNGGQNIGDTDVCVRSEGLENQTRYCKDILQHTHPLHVPNMDARVWTLDLLETPADRCQRGSLQATGNGHEDEGQRNWVGPTRNAQVRTKAWWR